MSELAQVLQARMREGDRKPMQIQLIRILQCNRYSKKMEYLEN